jgi:hypothetical protein
MKLYVDKTGFATLRGVHQCHTTNSRVWTPPPGGGLVPSPKRINGSNAPAPRFPNTIPDGMSAGPIDCNPGEICARRSKFFETRPQTKVAFAHCAANSAGQFDSSSYLGRPAEKLFCFRLRRRSKPYRPTSTARIADRSAVRRWSSAPSLAPQSTRTYLPQMSNSPPAVPSFIVAAIVAAARARASAVSIPTVASAAPRRATVATLAHSVASPAAPAAPANETVLFQVPAVHFHRSM